MENRFFSQIIRQFKSYTLSRRTIFNPDLNVIYTSPLPQAALEAKTWIKYFLNVKRRLTVGCTESICTDKCLILRFLLLPEQFLLNLHEAAATPRAAGLKPPARSPQFRILKDTYSSCSSKALTEDSRMWAPRILGPLGPWEGHLSHPRCQGQASDHTGQTPGGVHPASVLLSPPLSPESVGWGVDKSRGGADVQTSPRGRRADNGAGPLSLSAGAIADPRREAGTVSTQRAKPR